MDRPEDGFMYEHCDVPAGELLSDWRTPSARQHRRARVVSGMFAALATFAPPVMTLRAARRR